MERRRMCRVLRRALNEKSFLQVWGPRARPAEGLTGLSPSPATARRPRRTMGCREAQGRGLPTGDHHPASLNAAPDSQSLGHLVLHGCCGRGGTSGSSSLPFAASQIVKEAMAAEERTSSLDWRLLRFLLWRQLHKNARPTANNEAPIQDGGEPDV